MGVVEGTWDPAIVAAVREAIGDHGTGTDGAGTDGAGGAASSAPLAGLSHLQVRHARSLAGIEALSGLRVLTLIGCDVGSYGVLRTLKELRTVRIDHSDLADLTVFGLSSLLGIRILGCRVTDLGPLRSHRGLQSADVRGNPLEEGPAGTVPGVAVVRDDPSVRAVNRDLAAAGVPAALYRDAGEALLAPVGLAWSAVPEVGHAVVQPEEVRRALRRGGDGVRRLFDARRLGGSGGEDGDTGESEAGDAGADAPSSTPGLDLMAALSGRSREDLTSDPRALAAGVRALGDGLADLLAGLTSSDAEARAVAEARRAEILGRVHAAPPPGRALRETVSAALDEALRRLREAP